MNWADKITALRATRARFIEQGARHPLALTLATWFGSGLMIPAPGTWGTAAGVLCGLVLYSIAPILVPISAGVLYVPGLWAVRTLEQNLDEHDSSFIVIDEVVAILFVLALLPVFTPFYIVTGFIIFRILDAAKPFPISWLDRHVAGALGVMADDILAAIFTIIILWGIDYV